MFEIKDHLENRGGVLFIGGASTIELAEKYGTPLYAYDEQAIRARYKRLANAFKKHYPNFKCKYAIKANNNPAILNILRQEGAGADASCIEEIALAEQAGFKDILYSGVYHTNAELKTAIGKNVIINLEDVSQLPRLLKFGKPEILSFRINPGIGKGSFEGNIFGGPDAKFGVPEEKAVEAYRQAKGAGIKRFGIHMMTGSCVIEEGYFEQITAKLLDIAGQIHKELGIDFEFVDIGGGFGVSYKPGESDLNIEKVAENVCKLFSQKLKEHGLKEPLLTIEPGRFIVCEPGILLCKVHSIKEAKKKFIGVDAGLHTLLRPALYGAYHEIKIANRLNAKGEEKVNIVGQICENTDQLAKDRLMPQIEVGDILAILNGGSYGFSMSSQYNTRPRAAEVLVNNGKHELIRKRETLDDIVRNVVVPARLKK